MKVFVSWSGPRSLAFATTLRDWLPNALQYVDPFLSSKDIEAGARWSAEIAAELALCNYGIICVTQANMGSHWLNFEAGAISKVVEDARVAPIAIDLSATDITGPLSQFQVTERSEEHVSRLLGSINASAAERAIPGSMVTSALKKWWSDLDEGWGHALEIDDGSGSQSPRSERDMLEEILSLVRSQTRSLSRLPEPVTAGRRGRTRVPVLGDPETRRIIAEALATRLGIDSSQVSLATVGGQVVVSIPTEPTTELRRLVKAWGDQFGLIAVLRGPGKYSLSDLVAGVPEFEAETAELLEEIEGQARPREDDAPGAD